MKIVKGQNFRTGIGPHSNHRKSNSFDNKNNVKNRDQTLAHTTRAHETHAMIHRYQQHVKNTYHKGVVRIIAHEFLQFVPNPLPQPRRSISTKINPKCSIIQSIRTLHLQFSITLTAVHQ